MAQRRQLTLREDTHLLLGDARIKKKERRHRREDGDAAGRGRGRHGKRGRRGVGEFRMVEVEVLFKRGDEGKRCCEG